MHVLGHDFELGVLDESAIKWLLADEGHGSFTHIGRSFKPEMFTIGQRIRGEVPLDGGEFDFSAFLGRKCREIVEVLGSNGFAVEAGVLAEAFVEATRRTEPPLGDLLINNELRDFLLRLGLFMGGTRDLNAIESHTSSNAEALSRGLGILEHLPADPEMIRHACLDAGVLGLAYKSLYSSKGVVTARTSTDDLEFFDLRSASPIVFDDYAQFLREASTAALLTWFTDDILETSLDLLVIQDLLRTYRNLTVAVVPRRLPVYVEATVETVQQYLAHRRLGDLRKCGRFILCSHGPATISTRLEKLSAGVTELVRSADLLFVKGGNLVEAFHGGTNAPLYAGLVVAGELTGSWTGLASDSMPKLWFRLSPGQRLWRGLDARVLRHRPGGARRELTCPWSLADARGLKTGH